jgi:hypothetical protein
MVKTGGASYSVLVTKQIWEDLMEGKSGMNGEINAKY